MCLHLTHTDTQQHLHTICLIGTHCLCTHTHTHTPTPRYKHGDNHLTDSVCQRRWLGACTEHTPHLVLAPRGFPFDEDTHTFPLLLLLLLMPVSTLLYSCSLSDICLHFVTCFDQLMPVDFLKFVQLWITTEQYFRSAAVS